MSKLRTWTTWTNWQEFVLGAVVVTIIVGGATLGYNSVRASAQARYKEAQHVCVFLKTDTGGALLPVGHADQVTDTTVTCYDGRVFPRSLVVLGACDGSTARP